MATDELFGTLEEVGCLRSIQLVYAPGDIPFAGSNNGLRHGMEEPAFQNGSPV